MSESNSLWARVVAVFRPRRETYETRRPRGGELGPEPPRQYNHATDQRRFGGSGAAGGS